MISSNSLSEFSRLHLLVCLLLLGGFVLPVAPLRAQEPSPTSSPAEAEDDNFTLEQLGFDERTLIGPFDSADFYFSLPEHWELNQDGQVQLDLLVFFTGAGFQLTPGMIAGTLEISFNFNTVTSMALDWTGERTITVTLPASVLQDKLATGRHVLGVGLNSSLDCGNDIQTNVTIRSGSQVLIPHTSRSPTTDLTLLPRPIYQRTFLPDRAIVVIPDTPSHAELQAALSVVAGFARMTDGNLELATTTVSGLTEEMRATEHLIVVGKPDALPLLDGLELPILVDESRFASTGVATNDGILQMIVSPWNSDKVLMVVGGNTDRGVIRAGQTISSGTLQSAIVIQPDLILIDEITEGRGVPVATANDQTFADLGYESEVRSRKGWHEIEYNFSIPPGYVTDLDAHLDLIFNHSALVDYERSGLSVFLNDQVIGSIKFSDDTTEVSTRRISIPPSALRFGNNRVVILMALIPDAVCIDPNLISVWGTIWSESLIHLPLQKAEVDNATAIDLGKYPAPFTDNPTLANTAFVMPRDDPEAWEVAAEIVFHLGTRFEGELLEAAAVYGDMIPEYIGDTHDLLVVGRPSSLPLVDELRDVMPLPFEPQSDRATSTGSRVLYRFPDDVDLGYLELLPAPWNTERSIVMVLGTSGAGLHWAKGVLISERDGDSLAGNFAVISNETEIVSGDTRRGARPADATTTTVQEDLFGTMPISDPAVLTDTGSLTTGMAVAPMSIKPDELDHPGWVVPVIGASTVLMGVVVLIAATSALWRYIVSRRTPYRAVKERNL